jgi:hypothetical protein
MQPPKNKNRGIYGRATLGGVAAGSALVSRQTITGWDAVEICNGNKVYTSWLGKELIKYNVMACMKPYEIKITI